MYKKTGWSFAIIALLLGGAIWALVQIKPQFGIDLQGGTELVYELDLKNLEYTAGASIADTVKDQITIRLDGLGLKEISIATQGSDRIVVQLPGADSQTVEEYKRQVEEAGNLDFMLLAPNENQGRLALLQDAVQKYNIEEKAFEDERKVNAASTRKRPEIPEVWKALNDELQQYRDAMRRYNDQARVASQAEREALKAPTPPEWIVYPRIEAEDLPNGGRRFTQKAGTWTILHFGENYKVSGKYLSRAYETVDQAGRPAIGFQLNPYGAGLFGDLTGSNIDRFLAIVLDGRLVQSPRINSRISSSGIIEGDFTRKEIQSVVNILRAGSLPTKPVLVSESSIGSLLGQDSIQKGFLAIVVGLGAVLIFMMLFYRLGGLIANIAVVINIIFILAYVYIFRQTITFPGIAGILLTIGMAVDANILIFERVREELFKGKSISASLSAGYQRAFSVIFDSNLTTILSAVVLFEFGTGPVKGFAVALVAGLIASFFTAVFVTRVIFSFLLNIKAIKTLTMLHLFDTPRVDYISRKKLFIGLSIAGIALTWALFVLPRGMDNYGIDFTGGTKVTMNLSREIEKKEFDDALNSLQKKEEKSLFNDYSLQTVNAGASGRSVSFTLTTRSRRSSGASIADAQEPAAPATQQPAPAAQQPAPAAPQPAPVVPPAAPEIAAPANPVSAPAQPAGTAAKPSELKAPADEASTDQDYIRVRQVLERLLREKSLLLPSPFPVLQWEQAGAVGEKHLKMEVNLLLVNPKIDDARLRELLSAHLKAAFRTTDGFKGIDVASLSRAQQAVLDAATNRTITRYQLTTTQYSPPAIESLAQSDSPRQHVVEETIKKFFKGESQVLKDAFPEGKSLILCDPFPEVLTIGARVAGNLQTKAIIAVFISIVAMVFYLALRFEFVYGIGAIVALIHDVLITIGIYAMTDWFFGDILSFKINLPEVASVMTIIGFSVNDTIVIFDRIRENLQLGRKWVSFEDMVNASINQTLSRTIWTSGTAFLVTMALLAFGGESIKGFAFIFAIGIITGTYSSVFIASPVMIYLRKRAAARRERLAQEAAA